MFKANNATPLNSYPWWKYVVIVVAIVLACFYALPNLFGESPAVQVSPKGGEAISSALVTEVKQVLNQEKLNYVALEASQYSLEMRFNNTLEQMKAQSALQSALGNKFTVAINLAPNTPKWLTDLGAYPMKLGLDLRGGMYFLLDIDMQSVVNNRLNEVKPQIIETLRTHNFAWRLLKMTDNSGLYIELINAASAQQASKLIESKYPNLQAKVDAQNPQALFVNLTAATAEQARQLATEQTVQVMRNRVNELGVSEASVSRQGADQVVIELPGLQDAARAKAIIGGTATLKVMLADDNPSDIMTATSGGQIPYGTVLLYNQKNEPVLLKDRVIITGKSVVGADASFDPKTRLPVVNVKLSGPDVSYFSEVTGNNVGRPMAIVLVQQTFSKSKVNGKEVTKTQTHQTVINVATISQQLGANFIISGIGSYRSAQNLALMIRAGSLPAPVQIVEEKNIGPSLGMENIKMGTISVVIAMILVMIFITFYYRLFGLVANFALILNLIFIVAIMSLLPGATLTLPGIAGIVLNVGMAIDANVLIFERIREELRLGTTLQAAIHAGYARAFSTIVDSNVTTLIVAVILFAVGTGSVQGFAVTLIIGILTSMFTAITVTRAIINLIYGGRKVKSLSIGIKVGKG